MSINYLLELPENTGNIISPIAKLTVSGFLFIITLTLYKRHQEKRTILTRNMLIMMALYTLAPLFTSFDILLGWQNINVSNSYLGIGIGLIFNGLGNTFWLWFNLDVFLENEYPKPQQRKYVLLFFIAEIVATSLNLFLRLFDLWYWQFFAIIHSVLCLILFFTIFRTSKMLIVKVEQDDPHWYKLKAIYRAALFGLGSVILFAIDTFSDMVTVYSVIGWLLLMGMCYNIYRGYL